MLMQHPTRLRSNAAATDAAFERVCGWKCADAEKKEAWYRYVLFYFCNFPVHVFKPSLLLQMYEFLERKKVSENAW